MTLHDQLVAIDGISDAEVEIADDGPPSVRLQVDPGVDHRRVGELAQQILAAHGLKSRLAPARTRLEPSVPPAPPAEGFPVASDFPAVDTKQQQQAGAHVRRLASIAIEEERRKVIVTARDDEDGSATAQGQPGRRSLRDAIVSAVFELVGDGGVPPSVVTIHRSALDGRDLITVVLDLGSGDPAVGSAFVTVGWEFALGRAVWAALTG